MKNFQLLLLLLLTFCSICYADLTKNVLYLPSFSTPEGGEGKLKKSSSVTNHSPIAWIAGSVIKRPVKQLSVCLWVKSLNQDATGTLFAYLSKEKRIDFGLVGFQNKKETKESSDETLYQVYLVVKGKRSKIPISLRLDDVRWHHVCVTWSSRYGQWRVFFDGVKVKYGLGLKRGRTIDPNGTYFLGGAETQSSIEDGEGIVNGTEDSRVELFASTSFKTSRRKRAIFSPLIQRFVGKITDLYAWKKTLLKEQIRQIYDCTERFRNKFRNEVSSQLDNIRDLFENTNDGDQNETNKKMSWWEKNILYAWDVTTLSLRRPARLKQSSNLCGSMVNVECESNYMLITVDKGTFRSYNLGDSRLHLRNASCIPDEKENHWVFYVRDLTSCGTKRTMSGRDIVFSNEVSNGDPSSPVIYIGRQFSLAVQCKYPADITASTSQIIPGATPELVGRTTIENPTTKKLDLEAVFVLFEDDKFSKVYHEKTLLDSNDTVYGGIVVKGIDKRSNENINVVVDSCVMDADQHRIPMLDPTDSCGSITTLLGNGRIPQVRMRLSASHKTPRKPSYIECGIYPCVGSDCQQPCSQNPISNTVNSGPSNRFVNADRHSRKQRAIDEIRDKDTKPKIYYIRIGPIYYKEKHFDFTNQAYTENEAKDISYPIAVIPCVAVLVILTMAAIFSVFFLSRRTRALQYADVQWDSLGGTVRSRKQPIRANSFIYHQYNPNIYSINTTNCLKEKTCEQFTEV